MSLKKLDYLSRSQLQVLHNLKGKRNANRVLSNMSQYLSSFRHGKENVYYLNSKGRDIVSCEKVRKKTQNIEHFIMRNQLYMAVGRPSTWENEIKVKIKGNNLICDAKFLIDKKPVFVEVDNEQSMQQNRVKITKYREISQINSNFYIMWITKTDYRKKKLIELCEGLNNQVYSMNDIL